MSYEDLYNVFDAYKKNSIYRFVICLILIIIVTVLLVFFIKRNKQEPKLMNKIRNILIILIITALFLSTFINGIFIARIAYRLNQDCNQMVIQSACGKIDNISVNNKIEFIIIDSEKYILDRSLLGRVVYKGETYCIGYYENSKIIKSIESIEIDNEE